MGKLTSTPLNIKLLFLPPQRRERLGLSIEQEAWISGRWIVHIRLRSDDERPYRSIVFVFPLAFASTSLFRP